jgi:hypothetical protein
MERTRRPMHVAQNVLVWEYDMHGNEAINRIA